MKISPVLPSLAHVNLRRAHARCHLSEIRLLFARMFDQANVRKWPARWPKPVARLQE